jgi:hypothetical protein
MRRFALLVLWPLAAWAQTRAATTAPLAESKPEDLRTLEGRVFNAATGELVGKASLPLTRTESTAALTAAGLPQSYAGEYKVFAWEDAESGAWMDSEFMKPLEGKGESATVREGSQANVQATSIPAESGKEKAKPTEGSRP